MLRRWVDKIRQELASAAWTTAKFKSDNGIVVALVIVLSVIASYRF